MHHSFPQKQVPSQSHDVIPLNIIGWVLLGISILPIVSNLYQALSLAAREGYFALYQQEAGIGIQSGTQILAGFFVSVCYFYLRAVRIPGAMPYSRHFLSPLNFLS